MERPLSTRINEIKADIKKHLEVEPIATRLHLIYQGKVLEDYYSLGKPVRVSDGMVIQAFLMKNVTEWTSQLFKYWESLGFLLETSFVFTSPNWTFKYLKQKKGAKTSKFKSPS